jgi:hypothetical protein
MHTPWAGSHQRRTQAHALCQICRFRDRPTGTMISELNTIQGSTASRYLSSSHPFCVRFNESLRKRRQDHGFTILIDALQHSIPGLRLTATRAGIPPACHQNISSPHVQFIVHRHKMHIRPASQQNVAEVVPGFRRSFRIGIGRRSGIVDGKCLQNSCRIETTSIWSGESTGDERENSFFVGCSIRSTGIQEIALTDLVFQFANSAVRTTKFVLHVCN